MAYTKQQKESMFNKVIDYISNGMSLRTALKQEDVCNYRFINCGKEHNRK